MQAFRFERYFTKASQQKKITIYSWLDHFMMTKILKFSFPCLDRANFHWKHFPIVYYDIFSYLHVFYSRNPPFLSRQWFLKFQSSESEHIRKKIWDFLVTCLRKMSVKSECLHGLSKFKCVSLSTDQCRTLNLVEKNQSYCKKQKLAKIRFTDCKRYI